MSKKKTYQTIHIIQFNDKCLYIAKKRNKNHQLTKNSPIINKVHAVIPKFWLLISDCNLTKDCVYKNLTKTLKNSTFQSEKLTLYNYTLLVSNKSNILKHAVSEI